MRFPTALIAFLTILGLAFCNPARAQLSLRVSPESGIYDDLEHFRALGLWRGSLELRPMSRGELARAIEAVAARSDELGGADRRRLARLEQIRTGWMKSGREPRDADIFPETLWELGAVLRYRGGPANVDSLARLDRRSRGRGLFDLKLNAELDGRLSTQLRLYEDYSRFTRGAGDGNWVDNLPMSASDITQEPSARLDRAVIAYSEDWWELRFGREDRRWGVGRRGSLFLSENPFPLDGLSFHLRSKYVSLSSLFAQSQRGDQPLAANDSLTLAGMLPGEAYVACHRIELRPPGPLSLGLWEAAAYGGRGIDLAYANPVGFLVAMTQDVADQSRTDDKKVVGLDFRLDAAPFTFYGEFLLDRLVSLESATQGEDSGISSFGQLAGLRWANPFGLTGADLDVEYAHLDPQVYFHHDQDIRRALIRDDFLGEGAILGHWLGPNADALHLVLHLPPTVRLGRLSLEFERARWGMVDGLRGDEIGFFRLTKAEKEWITGVVVEERVLCLNWERRDWPMPVGRLDSRISLAKVDRDGGPTVLPPEAEWPSSILDSGWQVELELDWRFDWILLES